MDALTADVTGIVTAGQETDRMSGQQDMVVKVSRDVSTLDIPLPSYATPGASGMDVRAAEDAHIAPGERAAIGTGLHMEIPLGYEAQVRPRSGLALKHGITVLNAPGTIDSDYRGEVRIILINHGHEEFSIRRGDRIAQLVFAQTASVVLAECDALEETERAGGGFGHSGIR